MQVFFKSGSPVGVFFKGCEIFSQKFKGSENNPENVKGSENFTLAERRNFPVPEIIRGVNFFESTEFDYDFLHSKFHKGGKDAR